MFQETYVLLLVLKDVITSLFFHLSIYNPNSIRGLAVADGLGRVGYEIALGVGGDSVIVRSGTERVVLTKVKRMAVLVGVSQLELKK